MRILLAAATALLLAGAAQAATEQARRDGNRVTSMLGVSQDTTETRRVKTTDGGFLIVVSSSPGGVVATTVDQGAAGSQDWLVVTNDSGSDTPVVSTHSVSGTAVEVMAADASRESSLVCNEGPETTSCASASQVTASVGQRLLTDQCFTLDGPRKPYRGALSCVSTTGSPTKITASEAN